ncbi:hypothetical protein HRI_003002400 [Hibiscus trionum]|uniref:Ubiquitin-like domain-containing protein n=1 Tax=Hibiscus trionum TaxID=183268 RepID=A0A9W7IDI2_HIBTR|nr:hypothetical protein HRI_003002400 [Hibiscus trionum]
MDVIFENRSGKAFCIEVGFFDTVLEIKEKVQKCQGIPVSTQTLIFNGRVLEDERDVEYCGILHHSLIQLLVASDSDGGNYKQQPQVNEQQKQQTSLAPSEETVTQLNVNDPSSELLDPLEMDVNDMLLILTELFQEDEMEVEPVPVNPLVQSDGRQLTENNVVDANNMPPPPTSYGKGAAGDTTGSNMSKPKWNDVKIMPRPMSSVKGAAGATSTMDSNMSMPKWNDVKIIPRPVSSVKGAAGATSTSTTGSNTLKPTWNDVNIMPPPTGSGKGAAEATTGSNVLNLKWKDTYNVHTMPPPTGKGAAGATSTTGSNMLKPKWNDVKIIPRPMSSVKGAAGATSTSTTGSNMLKPKWNDVKIIPRPMSSVKGAAGATSTSTTGSNMLKPTWNNVNIMPPPTSSGKGAAEGTTGSNVLNLKWKDTSNVHTMPPPTGKGAADANTSTGSGKGAAEAKTTTSTGKLKLLVLPRHGTKKVEVEVNATDNVGDLRKELQKLQKKVLLPLPEEGYFFIHKQSVMDDDQSFKWHHVAQGDTIEIFNGYVTRGS